jgi:hypothetical protein
VIVSSHRRWIGSAFTGLRFPPDVITLAVRWYLRYRLSYRDVEELLFERGIEITRRITNSPASTMALLRSGPAPWITTASGWWARSSSREHAWTQNAS